MSFDLLPQIIIIVSIGIIVIILGRNIPKIKDLDNESLFFPEAKEEKEKERFFYLYSRIKGRINREEYQKRIDLMWVWLEKTLRKIRISFLKIDNKIVLLLTKLRNKQIEAEIEKDEQIGNAEKDVEEKIVEENKLLKKEAIIIRSELQGDKTPENVTSSKTAEIVDEDKNENKDRQEEVMNNISEKENAKGKEKEYIKMILKNPIDIKAYWNLGVVYSRRKNYKDAISCFRQITKIDPTYYKAKKKISDLMERMKRKDKENKSKDEDNNKNKEKLGSENAEVRKIEEKNDAQL